MLSGDLGNYFATELMSMLEAAQVMTATSRSFHTMMGLQLFQNYKDLGATMTRPHDVNFNQDYYPHVNLGPVWPTEIVRYSVPLASFLEQHFDEFRSDLQRISEGTTFWNLHADPTDLDISFVVFLSFGLGLVCARAGCISMQLLGAGDFVAPMVIRSIRNTN